MSATLNTQVVGINEAIRSLNKIEPGLRKQFAADVTKIAQPAIQETQRRYTALGIPLSGMARNWTDKKTGRKLFPFSPARAVRGVKVKLDADRRTVATILIQQYDAATSVFESAGRKNSNPLGNSLGSLQPGRTRILGPAVTSKTDEISKEIEQAAVQVVNRVNRELR
jgi:hypothetical protein